MIGVVADIKTREIIYDRMKNVEVRDLIDDNKNVMVLVERMVIVNSYGEVAIKLKGTVYYMLSTKTLKSFCIDTVPNWYVMYDENTGCPDLIKTEEEAMKEVIAELTEACDRLNVIKL